MPTAADLMELAGGGLNYLLKKKTVDSATGTYTGGLDAARTTIEGKSANLSALNRSIYDRNQATNLDVYGNAQATNRDTLAATNERLDPYSQAGRESLDALREGVRPGGGLTDPFKYALADLENSPGYKFRLAEGQKILRRSANADLNRFSGGSLKAAQQYQQDYASNEFEKDYTRQENTFRDNQTARYDRLNDMAGYGERAVTAQNLAGSQNADRENLAGSQFGDRENLAGNEYGNRETANQVLTSGQIADLQIEKADAEAAGNVEKSNALSQMISTGIKLAPAILSALGIGGAATAAATAGGAAATTAATTTAAGGGLGSTMAALATNPITIAVAGALAVGTVWLKSQSKWEANAAVKDFENPFHYNSLAPFAAEWDKAVKSGSMKQTDGQAASQQYYQNFEDYSTKIRQWAGSSKDKKKVAEQSIQNLWNTTVYPMIQRMGREIPLMGAA